ncbi:hypothetical protein U9M48_038323, partial [Paspalum notatum var. saurae]
EEARQKATNPAAPEAQSPSGTRPQILLADSAPPEAASVPSTRLLRGYKATECWKLDGVIHVTGFRNKAG